MAKMLVLVRHAKPEAARADVLDIDRPLTAGGIACTRESFPKTFSLIADENNVVIWSSPALRAWQTAELVAQALNSAAEEIVEHETIYAQDENAFIDEIAAAPEDVVVAVGHIPMVENLVSELCGANIDFKPGAVAAMELGEDLDAYQPCRLLWFVQGPRVKE